MGSKPSQPVTDMLIYNNEPNVARLKPLFEGINISEVDVRRFYSLFESLDVEKSGYVDVVYLLKYLDSENNQFMSRICSLQCTEQSTMIDFRSFVLVLWNICSLDHQKKTPQVYFV
jgi:Ca2+-binding EF-hand superfamily protein